MSPAQPQRPRNPSIGQSSPSQNRSSLTSGEDFSLGGPSDPPEPATHAYRKDLADVRLAGRVIASHYAERVLRHLAAAASLRSAPTAESEIIAELAAGDRFEMLDDTRGWAWGYGGPDALVGYVESAALSA